jgi:hypothetical protein
LGAEIPDHRRRRLLRLRDHRPNCRALLIPRAGWQSLSRSGLHVWP